MDAILSRKTLFQNDVFYRQIQEENNRDIFITDRSVFDPIAYSLYYGISHDLIKLWQEEAIAHSVNYYMIIYCPIPDEAITDDGFRLVDKKSQQVVDNYILALLASAKCSILCLSNDREKWCEEVLKMVW